MQKYWLTSLIAVILAFLAIQANFVNEKFTTKILVGDMLLRPKELRALRAINAPAIAIRNRRNAYIDRRRHWPGGVVYYIIDNRFSKWERNLIKQSMQHISLQTCIRFRQFQNNAKSYVHIRPTAAGCFADIGYSRGEITTLNLQQLRGRSGRHCFTKGTIVHELLHTLGIFHQQSAANRDQYVRILRQNIQTAAQSQYDKYSGNVVSDFGVGYDYASIMHYGLYDFTKNGKRTMTPIRNVNERIIGQQERLSSKDVAKINRMYNCRRA